MEGATVNMPLAAYQELQTKLDGLTQELRDAKAATERARMDDPSGKVPALVAAIRAAVSVTQYAVGNLPAEVNRGWPHAALTAFAQQLRAMPGISAHERETAAEFEAFAREAAALERAREIVKRVVAAAEPAAPAVPTTPTEPIEKSEDLPWSMREQ